MATEWSGMSEISGDAALAGLPMVRPRSFFRALDDGVCNIVDPAAPDGLRSCLSSSRVAIKQRWRTRLSLRIQFVSRGSDSAEI